MRLLIAGVIQDRKYYDANHCAQGSTGSLRYPGSGIDPARRGPLLAGAYALLHLINFDEPFGLSLIEAMACGTPVVARPRGSIPEILAPGSWAFMSIRQPRRPKLLSGSGNWTAPGAGNGYGSAFRRIGWLN